MISLLHRVDLSVRAPGDAESVEGVEILNVFWNQPYLETDRRSGGERSTVVARLDVIWNDVPHDSCKVRSDPISISLHTTRISQPRKDDPANMLLPAARMTKFSLP